MKKQLLSCQLVPMIAGSLIPTQPLRGQEGEKALPRSCIRASCAGFQITDGTDDNRVAPDMTLRIAHIIPFLYRILGEGAAGRHQEAGSRGVSSLPDSTGLTADPVTA